MAKRRFVDLPDLVLTVFPVPTNTLVERTALFGLQRLLLASGISAFLKSCVQLTPPCSDYNFRLLSVHWTWGDSHHCHTQRITISLQRGATCGTSTNAQAVHSQAHLCFRTVALPTHGGGTAASPKLAVKFLVPPPPPGEVH